MKKLATQSKPGQHWSTAVRILHWLTTFSLLGAASLTEHGEAGHTELGWIALSSLLIMQAGASRLLAAAPVLWILIALVSALNLSGWINPEHTVHSTMTFIAVIIGAFYFSTVVFEGLLLMTQGLFTEDSHTN